MGCGESKPEVLQVVKDKKSVLQGQVSEPTTTVPKVESTGIVIKKPHESIDKLVPNGNTAVEDSYESLVIKKEKRAPRLSNPRKTSQRAKPKELSQVQPAWGKRTTMNEDNFLEDLRHLRDTAGEATHYERDYHEEEADKTSRFVDGDPMDSSHSDILENSAKRHGNTEEESFDASQIIDVEKFRAANVAEKKQTSPSKADDTYKNIQPNLSINPSYENHKLHSSIQEITTGNSDSFTVLYNEDDNDLIKSIEQEFAPDYYLPGQIIN